jgi:serine/threonine-protein kinase
MNLLKETQVFIVLPNHFKINMHKTVLAISIIIIAVLFTNGLITGDVLNKAHHLAAGQRSSSSSPAIITITTSTDNNNTATNFLTYENSTYGIKIQYPPDWIYKEGENASTSNNNTSSSTPIQSIVNFIPTPSTSINIGVQDFKLRGMTADLLANLLIANKDQILPGADIIQSNSTTLAGNPAHKFIFVKGEAKAMMVFTIKGDKAYYVFYGTRSPVQYSTYLPRVQKMIDSFEITKAS